MAGNGSGEISSADTAPIDLIKAIAHPLRYEILACVAKGELNVGDIEGATGITQPTLSQQLSVLRNAGLVSARREAKLVFYAIEAAALEQVCSAFKSICPAEFQGRMLEKLGGVPAGASTSGNGRSLDVPADTAQRRRGGAAVFAKLD